ncbi:MAG: tRNA epoxyqueuosine(34) reductase QueG [Gammaproteobacteria bacterium]|nr:tRNA epoxyqueuosine(34) reductase QueG [Gammaproteobacteria bacterium]
MTRDVTLPDLHTTRALAAEIKQQALALGFQQVGISHLDLAADEALLEAWLAHGYHGEMHYLAKHGRKRSRPAELIPGTLSVICATLNYLPTSASDMEATLQNANRAYIARYALGRDYHKVMRGRLRQLAKTIAAKFGSYGHRVFSDSAPVLEKALARNAGLGWIGKHTNLLNREYGSWFFLGEIYTDIPLPQDSPQKENYCGSCVRCIEVCPTQAIIAPYTLDARRCIAYLTIEYKGSIPHELRPLLGNRIFGCDDCQLYCPWNRHAALTAEPDFRSRHALDTSDLLVLWEWDESTFLARTEGSAIRRVSYEQWQRNLAVALGNAPINHAVAAALQDKVHRTTALVREHIEWALVQQMQ